MKIALILLFISFQSMACVNRDSSARFIKDEALTCGILAMVSIEKPQLEVNRKLYPLALSRKNFDLKCPQQDKSCLELSLNLKAQMNAICKSYGFKQHLDISNYSYVFSSRPKTVGYLKLDAKKKYRPVVGPEIDSYLVVKSITCLDYI